MQSKLDKYNRDIIYRLALGIIIGHLSNCI